MISTRTIGPTPALPHALHLALLIVLLLLGCSSSRTSAPSARIVELDADCRGYLIALNNLAHKPFERIKQVRAEDPEGYRRLVALYAAAASAWNVEVSRIAANGVRNTPTHAAYSNEFHPTVQETTEAYAVENDATMFFQLLRDLSEPASSRPRIGLDGYPAVDHSGRTKLWNSLGQMMPDASFLLQRLNNAPCSYANNNVLIRKFLNPVRFPSTIDKVQ